MTNALVSSVYQSDVSKVLPISKMNDQVLEKKEDLDAILVKKAASGDQVAFNLLMAKYKLPAFRYAYQFVHSDADAQDVIQDVMLRAWKGLSGFRGESKFSTWLFTIVRNTALNHIKRDKGRHNLSIQAFDESESGSQDLIEELHSHDTPQHKIEESELKQVMLKAFKQLPDVLRQALELREISGLSYQEISEQQGCPIGTVRSRISRARDEVHSAINAYRSGEVQ